MDLNTIWYLLIGFFLIGYAILDGFDLGVGILSLFARSPEERRLYMNAIGPFWDGNEVWIITGGAFLFAAFPVVYATVFSGFYLALMLLLVALIARAVAIEFRGKMDNPRWQRFWDWAFGLGSLVAALLLPVALGNVLRGLPLGAGGLWNGSFIGLLNPYSLLIGLTGMTLLALHGALYLAWKTEGPHIERLHSLMLKLWTAFVLLYALSSFATALTSGFLFENLTGNPIFWVLIILLALSLGVIPRLLRRRTYLKGFLSSCLVLLSAMGLAAFSLYPRLTPARPDLTNSLTIYNASSSLLALKVMLIIALIGLPLVLGYTAYVYHAFRGKVKTEEGGY